MSRASLLAALAGVALASVASAQLTITAAGPVNSNGTAATPAPGTTIDFTNDGAPFVAGTVTINGTATSVDAATFFNELRVRVTSGGLSANGASGPGDTDEYTTLPLNNWTTALGGSPVIASPTVMGVAARPFTLAAGPGQIRFFESFDDGGLPSIDSVLTDLSITFNASVLSIPTNTINLGALGAGATSITGATSETSPVQFYRFSLGGAASQALGTFLDIDTELNTGASPIIDTGISIWRLADGALIRGDDDDGSGNQAQLTYGSTTIRTYPGVSGAFAYNGRDGLFEAGEYLIGVGHFNAAFNGTSIGFGTGSTTTFGSFALNFNTNIPAPGAAALFGLGGLLAARRRRA